jgi:hypothetical protein
MKRPKVPCPKCGIGWTFMGDELFDTLTTVGKLREATPHQVKAKLDPTDSFHATAFNNRLEDLRKLGFVAREKRGRNWVYSVVKK